MMKMKGSEIVLALLFWSFMGNGLGGEVTFIRCGGLGEFHTLRIDGCEGRRCLMDPGVPYLCEGDITPSSSSQWLKLEVSVLYQGANIPVIDAQLPNSSVNPENTYIIGFSMIPNDQLSGEFLPVLSIIRNDNDVEEICVGFNVQINQQR